MAAPAHAVVVGPLFEGAARALPRVEPLELRLPSVRLTSVGDVEYGLTDARAVERLDRAKADEKAAIDTAASDIASHADSSTAEAKLTETLTECGQEGLKKAAEDYQAAAEEGTAYPEFSRSFYYAVYGCLSSKFPYAQPDALESAANYLTGHAAEPAQGAVATAPTAFANWLDASGNDVGAAEATTSYDPGYIDAQSNDESRASSPRLAIVIGLGVLVVVGLIAYVGQRRSA